MFYNLIPQQKQMITKKAVDTNKSKRNSKKNGGGWSTRQEEMAHGGRSMLALSLH